MKKLTFVLVMVIACACIFATVDITTKFGYDTTAYGFRAKGLKFDFEMGSFKADESILEDEEIDLTDYAKKVAIITYGPSFTLGVDAKVGKNWAVGADASYILPTLLEIKGVKLLGGISGEILGADADGANVKMVDVKIARHDISKVLNAINDVSDGSINYSLNALKAHINATYNYDFKKIPVSLKAKTGVGFTATFINAEYKNSDGVEKIALNFYDFGLDAEADVQYRFNKTLSVEVGALCDVAMFNMIKLDAHDSNYKLTGNAFSFCLQPAVSARAAFTVTL